MWGAIFAVFGAIGLSLALAFVGSWIGGDAAEAGFYAGLLIGMPALLLLLPVLIVAVVVDYAGRRAYPAEEIVASWDVRIDGGVHTVSLPGSASKPDRVWVDGALLPVAWAPDGEWGAHGAFNARTFNGRLALGYSRLEVIGDIGVAALGGGPVIPTSRFALAVDGATVEEVAVRDGERRS